MLAAIDAHRRAGHEAGIVAGQESDAAGDFLGMAQSADLYWLVLFDLGRIAERCGRGRGDDGYSRSRGGSQVRFVVLPDRLSQ